jgi:ABC-type Fe3+-hydroxamate transport system substrate-binding protein
MAVFVDQLNRRITLDEQTPRIISLVPSQTELLHYLGLEDEVVGITKFCVHPESWFRNKTRIGGTKTVNISKVKALNPTLIIANKEENTKSDLEALEEICPVWISDVRDIQSALEMIEKIGELVDKRARSRALIELIQTEFKQIHAIFPLRKVLYVIWNDPLMVAAKDTFIHAILEHLGLQNAAAGFERYPELSITEAQTLEPDYIFLSSEPFPFKEKHLNAFKSHFPKSSVTLVDGELFSWYGSRLTQCAPYFIELKKQIEG